MISAMPAVAVRRERKRSQSRASSRANSLASVHGVHNKLTHSISTISSTGGPPVTCTAIPLHCRRALAQSELRYARLRFLMKTGTVLMASGLVLIFLGVGMKLPHVQHIAFLFIAVGVVCCVVKITLAEAEHVPAPSAPSTVYTAPSTPGDENECTSLLGNSAGRRIHKSSSTESNMSVASTSSRLLSPDLPPPPPLPQPPGLASKPRRLPRSPSQESSFGTSHFASYKRSPRSPPAESNQFFTNSSYLGHIVTPTGLNSIPETQVLITVDRERSSQTFLFGSRLPKF